MKQTGKKLSKINFDPNELFKFNTNY